MQPSRGAMRCLPMQAVARPAYDAPLTAAPPRACRLCVAGQVLSKVEEANQVGRKLPPDGFYNQLIR